MKLSPRELVEAYLESGAIGRIALNRDPMEGYKISVDWNEEKDCPGPSATDALALLPSGSAWIEALGWHSFIGIPFVWRDRALLAVGLEEVIPIPDRGAALQLVLYVHPLSRAPSEGLRQIASGLISPPLREFSHYDPRRLPRIAQEAATALCFLSSSVVPHPIAAASRTPDEHREIEAKILRRAAATYDRGFPLMFRTLILSESEFPARIRMRAKQRGQLRAIHVHFSDWLVATAPMLRAPRARGNSNLGRAS